MSDWAARTLDVESGDHSPGGGNPPEQALELDYVYEAVANPRRRYLCYTLLEEDEWSLTELATKTAAWEEGIPEHAVTEHQRDRVYVALYHAHVPKLVDEGIMAFDELTETVTPGENVAQVLAALEAIGTSLDTEQAAHARSEMDDEET